MAENKREKAEAFVEKTLGASLFIAATWSNSAIKDIWQIPAKKRRQSAKVVTGAL